MIKIYSPRWKKRATEIPIESRITTNRDPIEEYA